ncbi:MAG TPA: hypothetical protein DDY58_00810, partial [Terrisporobacter glycolicus]
FYVYYKAENKDCIVEKILSEDVFLITIINGKKYKNKIEKVNKVYKSTYEFIKLKAKNYF